MGMFKTLVNKIGLSMYYYGDKNSDAKETAVAPWPMPAPSLKSGYAMNGVNSKSNSSSIDLNMSNGFNFVIYPADGGKVIRVSNYDEKTDRHRNSLYIIADNEDLGEQLGMIVTRECLTR